MREAAPVALPPHVTSIPRPALLLLRRLQYLSNSGYRMSNTDMRLVHGDVCTGMRVEGGGGAGSCVARPRDRLMHAHPCPSPPPPPRADINKLIPDTDGKGGGAGGKGGGGKGGRGGGGGGHSAFKSVFLFILVAGILVTGAFVFWGRGGVRAMLAPEL